MKIPANCPAFRFRGKVYEGRPGMIDLDGDRSDVKGLTLIDGVFGIGAALLVGTEYGAKLDTRTFRPLTKAARKLVAWVRQ